MGFRFQRRITLFPGVRLNFSARGISTTIGVRGASINFGPNGRILNLGLSGTGLSFRQHLGTDRPNGIEHVRELSPRLPPPEMPSTEVRSAPVEEVTSEGLGAFKDLIEKSASERDGLRRALEVARSELADDRRRLRRAEHWFFKLFIGRKAPERRAAVERREAEVNEQEERLAGAFVDADFGLDEASMKSYAELVAAFDGVAGCARVWDVTASRGIDRATSRRWASVEVSRAQVQFAYADDDEVVRTDSKVLHLGNANGADLFIYPAFAMMCGSQGIALLDLRELSVVFSSTRFTEGDGVPEDATVVGQAWAKSNKDGSPDRRFRNNYQIPIALYGELSVRTPEGVNEEYLFSSHAKGERFAEALKVHQANLRALGNRASADRPAALPPAEGAPFNFHMRSLDQLKRAAVSSRADAATFFQHFAGMLGADVQMVNGRKLTVDDAGRYLAGCAEVMPAVEDFFRRSPLAAPAQSAITGILADMMRQVAEQVRPVLDNLRTSATAGVKPKVEELLRAADRLGRGA